MPYHSEIPIIVFATDLNDPKSVVVVPDEAYIMVEKQTPHWVSWQGKIIDVKFEDVLDKPEKPEAHKGHCKMMNTPVKRGSFKYTLSLRVNGNIYTADPQLGVGD